MKYLVIGFYLIFSALLTAQYTAIPDPNFEAYLEENEMGDGIDGNGQVLTANIENVVELGVSAEGISDLTGIEDFTALEELGCTYNNLTSLDVSHNKNLINLVCNINFLSSLTLDNPNLEVLICTENNLTSINLSNSPNLTRMEIGDNSLTELDVSNNPNIELLICSNNNLMELDTSQNINLEMLWCYYNDIESLDFQNNPNLVWISASHNSELNYLDVRNGNNENMVSFSAANTDNLQCIYVDDASAPYLEDWYVDEFTHFVNNEQECDELNTENQQENKLIFYPNPVHDKLIVENQNFEIQQIKIMDVSGKLLLQQKIDSVKTEIDFSKYPKGMYFLIAQSANGNIIKTEKIIKS
jgi:hypothetical protein